MLAKVTELEGSLDAMSFVSQLPLRHLDMEALGFLLRQRWDAAAAGGAHLVSQCIGHGGDPSDKIAEGDSTNSGKRRVRASTRISPGNRKSIVDPRNLWDGL